MTPIKRNWEMLSKENKRKCVNDLIGYFETERDEKIGIIAAENLLDHFLEKVGKQLYNKGVEDSIDFLKERFESLELDMAALVKE